MRSFGAFFKKELLEFARSGKLMILGILFCSFGIMNPAIAKLTPWMLQMLADELAESGMTVTEVTVDALTSWMQFFKNIPIALIAFVLMTGGAFTKEYESGTLVLMLTRGLERFKVVLAKTTVLLLTWSASYFLCFGITYAYNAYYWDNSIATDLLAAAAFWWLFGVFTVALTVLFSVVARSYGSVLCLTGGCIVVSYIVGLIPKLTKYTPTSLANGMNILVGAQKVSDFTASATITAVISVLAIASSVWIFNKKQI